MDNELQDLVAFLSAQGRAQSKPQLQQAYSSMSVEPQETVRPMRGNSGAGWGADIPAGPTDFSQNASYYRQAPGYSPGRGSMTPDVQAAEDRAWEERQRMWDAEEARRNALEDQSYAQSRLREGAGPPAMREWQKYQDVMAQPYVRPERDNPPINGWPMQGIGRQGRRNQNPAAGPGLEDQFGDILTAVGGITGLYKILAGLGGRAATAFAAPALRAESAPTMSASDGVLQRILTALQQRGGSGLAETGGGPLRLPPGVGGTPPPSPVAPSAPNPDWMKYFNPGWEGAIPQKVLDVMARYHGLGG